MWALHESAGGRTRSGARPALTLMPKPVNLKEHRSAHFVDVAAAPAPPGHPPGSCGVYALAAGGVLVLMRGTARTHDRTLDVQVRG